MRNDDIPKTKSPSSATRATLAVPGVDTRDNRMVIDGQTSDSQPLGDVPIKVSQAVKVKNFTSPTRIVDDYENKAQGEKGNSPLDGQKEIMPADAPKKTFINTGFSIK